MAPSAEPIAGDLVHLVEAGPCEEDHGRAVGEVEAGLHRPEGDLALVVGADDDDGRRDQVEIVAIPQIGLDDPPTADQLAVRRHTHLDAAMSLGNRTRL